jgi:hypothetical protein
MDRRSPPFVLIHSPLIGPFTWSLVAAELQQRGVETVVPTLVDDGGPPFWRQHVEGVMRAVRAIPPTVPLALVGHSGAGPLLPAIGQGMDHPVAAYVFVDAGIPADGMSRLDLMETEDPAFARHLRQQLAAGGHFPPWTDADLAPILPEPRLRRHLIAQLQPRSLAFFAEPIPVAASWPGAPCGYLKFSPAYAVPAREAQKAGWRYRAIDAGHFHMLVDPAAVAAELLDLVPQSGWCAQGGNDDRPEAVPVRRPDGPSRIEY